jgi:hypothetical protein
MTHLATQGEPLRAFFIYSRKDKEIRDSLESHLGVLRKSGRLQCFHDGEIVAGQNWEPEIIEALERAHIIIMLVSADSLNSEYCDKELSRALKRHAAGEARVIPVLTRHVDWHGAPFAHIQLLPRSQIPIAKAKDRDEALSEIAAEIRKALDAFTRAPPSKGGKAVAPAIPGSEGKEMLRQALEVSGSSDAGKVARKIKLLRDSDQKWLMDELVRKAKGKKASSAVAVFGAACELYEPEQLTEPLNQLLRSVALQEDVPLKAALLEAVPPKCLQKVDPTLLLEFFDEIIAIVLDDQFPEVNVITAPLVEAQEALPEKLYPDYVEALLSQAESMSYQGAPAAREGLRNLPEAIAESGFSLLDAEFLCTYFNKKSVREFVKQYQKLAPAKTKTMLRDYLAMSFRDFLAAYADD